MIAACVPHCNTGKASRKIDRRKRYNKRARRKPKPDKHFRAKRTNRNPTTELVVVHLNIAAAPSNMAMHYLLLDHLNAHIAVFIKTKLPAPAAMYPPPENFGWIPTHIDAQMGFPHAGVLTGSNSGGVTILIRQDLGIVLTDIEVVQDFYGQTLIMHRPHGHYRSGL
jgi:hypothetical protein